jgi:hypothetical protein
MGGCKVCKMRFFFFRLIRILIMITGFLVFAAKSEGQKLSRFSGDSTKFITELNTLFQNLRDEEEKMSGKLMESFIQKWNSEQYSPSKKQLIYSICNQMLKKRMHPYPDFYNYISSIDLFIGTHQADASFYDWSAILKDLLASNTYREYQVFLDASINLFTDRSLYKTSATNWKLTNGNFRFIHDTLPAIEVGQTDLVCYAYKDSLSIYSTRGTYYPLSMRWKGKGGRVDWRRAGLDPQEAYADLESYSIQMNFSKFTADSVIFNHRKYFPSPLKGKYTDKIVADVTEDKATYPRFSSYDKDIGIKNLFQNIDFLGGFDMEGSRILGTGTKDSGARLTFRKNNQEFVVVRSPAFVIRHDRIVAGVASIVIHHEEDSIYHPGLQMKYIDEKKELSLSRDERMIAVSPWFDSWHKIEIYCETLTWKVNEPIIQFEMMKGPNQEGRAIFESSDYFSMQRYEKLQGIDDVNPIYSIKRFCDFVKSRTFHLDDLVTYIHKPAQQVEAILLTLASKGLLIYDADEKVATVNEKLYNYFKARNGLVDYNVIFFNSLVKAQSNAILNLDTFDLKIRGVSSVFLSDSQQVHIYPANREVDLIRGGDFRFSGKVEAGLFDFYGHDFFFDYTKFKLDLPFVDSMGIYVLSHKKDPKTQLYPLVLVKTYITNLSGDLLIDDPGNKSGLKKYPDYPIFNSKDNSMVNWDKRSVQNGVYKKDKFFYSVDPFTLKSLGTFTTDSLKFKGYLSSAGIFPDLREPLQVRPDYSLGIQAVTPSNGLPMYGGRGTFFSAFDMSNEGFKGNGKISYLNSVSVSDNFIFYPDSVKALVKDFTASEVLANVEYPSIKGDSLKEFWLPYHDSLLVENTRKDMVMYNGQSGFSGQLSLTPEGLSGNGTMKIKDSEMDSKRFVFKRRTFDANIANFRIKSYDLADLTISTKNYQTHFDFENRKGNFKSIVGISRVDFPFNKYICSMDRFDWLIDNDEITLYNDRARREVVSDSLGLEQFIDMGSVGSEFISVHPDQDSLKFFALHARYNLKKNVIYAEEVRIIKVGDAAIFPDSGRVCIMKNAQMRELKRAVIIANTATRYHHFYNANVSITSRKKYTATGNYDFVERNGEKQQVYFSRIGIDTAGHTFAKGYASDSSNFLLSPEFAFMGDIGLRATQKFLNFDGGFRVITDCFPSSQNWTAFTASIDPSNVLLPLSVPLRDLKLTRLSLGVLYSKTGERIFPAFFDKRQSFSDSVLFTPDGLLDYDPSAGEFTIMSAEKRKDPEASANKLTLKTSKCLMEMNGKVNLGMNSGALEMETFGTMDYYIIPDSISVRAAIALNFPFPEAPLEKINTMLNSINLQGLVFSTSPYFQAVKQILGNKEFEKVKGEMEMVGRFKKFPEGLIRTLFIADANMSWDSVNKSWISRGKIGIGCVSKYQVNRYVDGIIEFDKHKNGDDFTIYLELTKNDWFFFNYRNNLMQVISSNLEFNDMILKAVKSNSEQKKMSEAAKRYRFSISTERKKRDFLRKFETENDQE